MTALQPRTKCPDTSDKMSSGRGSVGFRKPHAECASTADFAFHRNLATLALDQCLTYGKTKAGALATLRREEGIEHLLHHIRWHANAGVAHFDDDARIAVPLGVE